MTAHKRGPGRFLKPEQPGVYVEDAPAGSPKAFADQILGILASDASRASPSVLRERVAHLILTRDQRMRKAARG